jgi:muramoyltetrapeptide carboxypeptidase
LLSSLPGTPWEIDTRGKILLLEDVGEEPCRIDRFLTRRRAPSAVSPGASDSWGAVRRGH